MKKLILNKAVVLENGKKLPVVEIAYQTYGKLNDDKSNIVWVCHALTANADVLDWWQDLFEGDNAAFPLNEYFVVCANILGSCYGTTGPLSIDPDNGGIYGHHFPEFTIRDMATLHEELFKYLNIKKVAFLVGASLGGQQAMEWAIARPKRFEHLVLLATNAKHSSWGIAFNESQRMAIEVDPSWKENSPNAGIQGMKVARSIALLSYRSHAAYVQNQIDDKDKTDEFKASAYQRYQGEKLAKRFNAFSYYYLSKAMDSHNVGRNRGGTVAALSRIEAETLIIGVDSDSLFPLKEQRFLARHILHSQLKIIHSDYGHDGFLVDAAKVSKVISEAFQKATLAL